MDLVLTFRLADRLFGLEVDGVQEILETPRLHFIPRAPAGFLGAINCHGSILPVLDLAAHLGLTADHRDTRIVVLAPERCAAALAVTALQRFVPLAAETLRPVAEAQRDCVGAVLEHDGEEIHLLDVGRLRSSLEKISMGTGGSHGA